MSYKIIEQVNIYHKQGTSSQYPPRGYASWMEYWRYWVGSRDGTSVRCAIQGCSEEATDGAHVQLTRGCDTTYIIPVCRSCNSSGKSSTSLKMQVNRGIRAVRDDLED